MTSERPVTARMGWWFAIAAGVLVAVIVLPVIGFYGLAQTDSGRAWIARSLSEALSTPGEAEISIGRLEGWGPNDIRLSGLTVSDGKGPWLSASSIEIGWRPLALLSRRLEIATLTIIDLRFDRRPEVGDEGREMGLQGIASLPLGVVVERLAIEGAMLGPEILGQAASFRITGAAAARELDRLTSSLVVERTDGVPGRIEATAHYTPSEDHLAVDASINEPSGGLIARALGLPDLPAIATTLSGDGPLDDWHGALTIALDGLTSLTADVALHNGEAVRFSVAGTASSAASPDRLPWRLLAGDLAFEVDGEWRSDRILVFEHAWLDGPAARFELSGRLAAPTLDLDARASVRLKDSSIAAVLESGAAVDELRVEVQARGPLLQPKIQASATAENLTAPRIDARGLSVELSFDPTRPITQPLQGDISVAGRVENLQAAVLEEIEPFLGRRYDLRLLGAIDLDKDRLEASDLSIEAGSAQVSGGGTFGLADGTADATLHVTLGDLDGVTPLIGLGVHGRGEIEADVEVSAFGRQATADLTGTLSEVRLDEPISNALFSGDLAVAANVALRPDAGFTVSDIKVDSAAARLKASARFSEDFGRIEADYLLRVADTAVLSDPTGVRLQGRGETSGRAVGATTNPRLTGRLTLASVGIDGHDFRSLDVGYSGEDLPTRPRGRLEWAATSAVGKIEGSGNYLFVDPEFRLTELRLSGPGSVLRGSLTVPVGGGPLVGSLTLEAENLAPWLGLVGLEGAATGTADLHLSAEGGRQAAQLEAALKAVAWQLENGEVLRGRTADLSLRTSDLMGPIAGSAKLVAKGVSLAEMQLDEVVLSADGDRSDAGFHVKATGTVLTPLTLQAAGRFAVAGDRLTLGVTEVEGLAFQQAVRLRRPVSISVRGDAFEVSPLDIQFGAARLSGAARVDADRLSAHLDLNAAPIETFAAFWPISGVEGEVSGSFAVDGTRDNPAGKGQVTVTDMRFEALDDGTPFEVVLSGDWRQHRLNLVGRFSGPPMRSAEFAADLPLRFDPDRLALVVPPDKPLSGRLAWQGQIASVWPLVPLDGHRLSGETDLIVRLAGSLSAVELSGSLQVRKGEYENLQIGTLLDDLDLKIDFDDRRAVLSRLEASDGGVGRLSATGEIEFAPQRGHPFKLDTAITEFAAVRRDDVTAVTSGHLTFAGSVERAVLSGQLQTQSVELRIIERLPADVIALDVVETGTPKIGAILDKKKVETAGGTDVFLDVAIAMPKRVFVRGRGLDSEWSGDLRVSGPVEVPVVEGNLSLVRGRLSVLGKEFRLVNGVIRFPGGSELIPLIEVESTHKAKDLTVTAQISGPAIRPSISLKSTPDLPRDEIVSRILFGKTSSKLSAIEAAQLAAAVAELTGGDRGFGGVLDFARGLVGADVLRIEATENGNSGAAAVQAGKYVTDNVYVGVKKGVTDGSGAVGVEVEVTPNISVESETGTTGGSDIGVKFKWDY